MRQLKITMGKPSRWHVVAVNSHMTVVGFVIKLSPYSIKLHDMKVCGRVEIPDFVQIEVRGLLHMPVTAG
jgi:hypothetical protein